MKLLCIAGARPNFIKIGPLMEAFGATASIEPLLVHTGQHYDEKMSELFFRQLGIPEPAINLGVDGGTHATQTASIMTAFEPVLEKINDSGADLLFVAMGSPKQEQWIARHRSALRVPFCMGVGGTFDVVSGHAAWAPAVFRKTGTEFLYRLMREPKRWRRQLELPVFVWAVVKARMFGGM